MIIKMLYRGLYLLRISDEQVKKPWHCCGLCVDGHSFGDTTFDNELQKKSKQIGKVGRQGEMCLFVLASFTASWEIVAIYRTNDSMW